MKSAEILFHNTVSHQQHTPRPKTRIGLFILVMLIASYGYFIHRGPQWNADTRLDLTFALVDQHSITIDSYQENTEDKSFHNGHYYTDKAIGSSLLAVPFYSLFRQGLFSSLPPEAYFLIRYMLTFFVVSIPSAIFGMLFYTFLTDFLHRRKRRESRDAIQTSRVVMDNNLNQQTSPVEFTDGLCLLVALGFSLGTIAFPYSTVFFGHQLAAIMLFSSFVLLFNAQQKMEHTGHYSLRSILLAGFFAGFASLTEYPSFIGLLFLGIYAALSFIQHQQSIYSNVLRNGGAFLLGAVPPVLVILGYNYAAFGNPLSQGYANLGGSPEFITGMSQGIMGITHPTISALWGITFSSYRGLFFLSPFLVLALPGMWFAYRAGWRSEILVFVAISIGFLTMNASYQFWDGGYSLGPRHIIPSLPFLTAPVVFAAAKWPRLTTVAVIWSILVIGTATVTNPLPSPAYSNPLFDLSVPSLLLGKLNNNWGMVVGFKGLLTLIPLALVFVLVLPFLLVDLHSRAEEMRLRAV